MVFAGGSDPTHGRTVELLPRSLIGRKDVLQEVGVFPRI